MSYRAIFDTSPNPYVLLDPDLMIVEMNEAYLRVTGRLRDEIIGRHMFEAFPSDPGSTHGRQLRGSLARVLRSRSVDHIPLIRYDIRGSDGGIEERYWSATHTPLPGRDDDVAFVLQHTVDVTELHRLRVAARSRSAPSHLVEGDVLRRAEAVQQANISLDAERRELRRLFEQAPSFMAVLSGATHVFTLANAAYQRLVGHRDVVGKPVREALPEIEGQGFLELLDRVYASGKPFVGRRKQVTLQSLPGAPPGESYLDFVYQPIFGSDGAVSGIFVQGHDISEQMRAEAALRDLNETLELQVDERTRQLRRSEDVLRQAQKMASRSDS